MHMKRNLVRFEFWLDPIFDRLIAQRPEIDMKVCQFGRSDAENWTKLQTAHAYHLCAARDEVPQQWRVTDALLDQTPDLLCVSSSGAGYDTIDVDACNRHGVLVVNQSGCNADSVAEHTMGLLLSVKHRVTESDRSMRAGVLTTREDLMGHEIKGLTIGIVGVGNIGRRVASLARAFGMRVLGTDPYLSESEMIERAVQPVALDDLLSQSDVVSVHCPRSAQTLNLFNAQRYEHMKTGAVFISTARGGIHDEAALIQALESGHLSGAALDVWTVEPPDPQNRLLHMNNVVSTYHTAGVTHEARRNAARMAGEQLIGVLGGQRPARLVNPQQWDGFVQRYKRIFGDS
jgi:D-3-phosphoglycerate dehydrogenase / 2-oxoglutarate reductase